MEAIILAGGLGTRLRSVVQDVPKPMAPVAGRPFLEYLLEHLSKQGLKRAILSVGYKGETVQQHFGATFAGIELAYAYEAEPLGTGGGIQQAAKQLQSDDFFILNGDTIFTANLQRFWDFFQEKKADLALALCEMQDFERYGVVETDNQGRVEAFLEKKPRKKGLINAGIYLCRRATLQEVELPRKFSFEKDFLERYLTQLAVYGLPMKGYFLDIGIPEDYTRAQEELLEI